MDRFDGGGADVRPRRPLAVRIAALLYVADAGFGIAMPITLAHLARTGELPMTPFGFRSFSGPFEQLGRDAFTGLGWMLVAVWPLTCWPASGCGRASAAAPGWGSRQPRLRSRSGSALRFPSCCCWRPSAPRSSSLGGGDSAKALADSVAR